MCYIVCGVQVALSVFIIEILSLAPDNLQRVVAKVQMLRWSIYTRNGVNKDGIISHNTHVPHHCMLRYLRDMLLSLAKGFLPIWHRFVLLARRKLRLRILFAVDPVLVNACHHHFSLDGHVPL